MSFYRSFNIYQSSKSGSWVDILDEQMSNRYFAPSHLMLLNKIKIILPLEHCCSHVWGNASPSSLSAPDAIQNRAVRLIGYVDPSSSLESLSFCRKVSRLCLVHRHFHGRCSETSLLPPSSVPARATRLTAKQHPYSVKLFTNRTAHSNSTFFRYVSSLEYPSHSRLPYNVKSQTPRIEHYPFLPSR